MLFCPTEGLGWETQVENVKKKVQTDAQGQLLSPEWRVVRQHVYSETAA